MIKVKTNKYENRCDECENLTTNWLLFENDNKDVVLCDDCLQELNRKIVNYLADKHL